MFHQNLRWVMSQPLKFWSIWHRMTQVKTPYNVVIKAPDNIVWKKILCNAVLILPEQHVMLSLRLQTWNLLGPTLHRLNHCNCCAMLSLRLQRTLYRKKILSNIVLILLEQHCAGKTLGNVVFKTPDNIMEEIFDLMLF